MSSDNKVFLHGNVGQDPGIHSSQSGSPVATFSLATKSVHKDRQGQRVEETKWHRLVAFGKLAETISQYVHKGSELIVWGELNPRKYKAKDGSEQHSVEVVVSEMTLGRRPDGQPRGNGSRAQGHGYAQPPREQAPQQRQQPQSQPQPRSEPQPLEDDFYDNQDIPF